MVNFNFSFDPGTTLQQMVGFETAGRIWSSYLTDNVTVNLQVGVSSSLGSKVIGGALPGVNAKQSYSSFTTALKADAKSADDQTALKEIYGSRFDAEYEFLQAGIIKLNGEGESSSLNLTRAEAKALGLQVSGNATTLDGYILFGDLSGGSVQWSYDYTRSAAAPAKSIDFLSTALHEIGHILGFTSGLDSPTWIDATIDNFGLINGLLSQLDTVTTGATPLDLFRYSTNSLNRSDDRTLSLGGTKAFALDDNSTTIAYFATGSDTSKGGNGYQASHWAAGTNALMAPTLKTGTRSAITATDLKAFDVLGWDLASNGINTAINLSTLQAQSKQSLATRLGQTVSWLDANSTAAAQSLSKDRSAEVYTMAVNSQIYDLSRITLSVAATTAKLAYDQLLQEQGLFETIDDVEVQSEVSIQSSLEALIAAGCCCENCYATATSLQPSSLEALVAAAALPKDDAGTFGAVHQNESTLTTPPTGFQPQALAIVSTDSRNQSFQLTVSSSLQEPSISQNRSVNAVVNLSSQSVQPLTSAASITPSSALALTGKADYYFYGNSKPVAYEASDRSGSQQFAPLPVLVDLGAVL